jgi:hypothetical protein
MNGKTSITLAQKHYHVDSVIYSGVLSSGWENEEIPGNIQVRRTREKTDQMI